MTCAGFEIVPECIVLCACVCALGLRSCHLFTADQPCAVNMTDGTWHRGQVIRAISADLVEIRFVDYGGVMTLAPAQ